MKNKLKVFISISKLLGNDKILYVNRRYKPTCEKKLLIASRNTLILIDSKEDERWISFIDKMLNWKYYKKRRNFYHSEKYSPLLENFEKICDIYERALITQESKIDINLLKELKEYFCNLNNVELSSAEPFISFEKKLIKGSYYGY